MKKKNIEKIKEGNFTYTINLDKKVVTCVCKVRGLKGIGFAKCNPGDDFNLGYGADIAKLRAIENAYSNYNDGGIDEIQRNIEFRKNLIDDLQRAIDYDQTLINNWTLVKTELKQYIKWINQ